MYTPDKNLFGINIPNYVSKCCNIRIDLYVKGDLGDKAEFSTLASQCIPTQRDSAERKVFS